MSIIDYYKDIETFFNINKKTLAFNLHYTDGLDEGSKGIL